MSLRVIILVFLALSAASVGLARAQAAADNGRKQAHAMRIGEGSIRLDGRLDEDVWRLAPPLTDFVQKEPDEGQPATDPTDVRFVYDDDALYIGARR